MQSEKPGGSRTRPAIMKVEATPTPKATSPKGSNTLSEENKDDDGVLWKRGAQDEQEVADIDVDDEESSEELVETGNRTGKRQRTGSNSCLICDQALLFGNNISCTCCGEKFASHAAKYQTPSGKCS